MEVVMEVDLLVEEQAILVNFVEIDKQLAAEDIADMLEDIEDMADDTVDMAEIMVGMVEDMVGIVDSIAEMVSIVVVGNFGAAMAWVHPRFLNIHLILCRKLQILVWKHTCWMWRSWLPWSLCAHEIHILHFCVSYFHIIILQNIDFRAMKYIMIFSKKGTNLNVF